MLVSSKEILHQAMKGGYAIPAFNINNLEILQAVITAASEEKSPVIIQTSEGALDYVGMSYLSAMTHTAASENPKLPVVFHLDHGKNFDLVKKAIKSGFYTSVMYDGSSLPLRQNIAKTKQIVKLAHALRPVIQVEAELGSIAGQEDKVKVKRNKAYLTDPDEAQIFVKETGCDSLAIAIGTVHGVYKYQDHAHLDFDRLKEIRKKVNIPLVLHGASEIPHSIVSLAQKFGAKLGGAKGVASRLLKHAVQLGINKVNIDSDLRLAFDAGVRQVIFEQPDVYDPRKILGRARELMNKEAREKIKLCGSANKI